MACDLKVELESSGLPAESVEIILNAFKAGRPSIEKLKVRTIDNSAKSAGASIISLTTDLASENLTLGAMDKVQGNVAPERMQPVAIASSGTSYSPVDEPISSSGLEDYPDSIVDMDSAGNWKKINKKTGQVDWVHNSGSKISFYKNGDVVIHTAGNLKQVVENDYIIEVGRNFEVTSGKETHITSKEDMFVTSELNLFETTTLSKVQMVPTKVQMSTMTTIVSPILSLMGSATVSNSFCL